MSSPSDLSSRILDFLENTSAARASSPTIRSHREDLGGGQYITRYSVPVLRRLEIDDWIEIVVEDSTVALPPDTLHTRDGTEVRIISDVWHQGRIHEGDEEDANRDYKRARVPASSKAILCLPEVSAGDAATAECAVCLQDFVAEDKMRALPCSHSFHQHCIFDWLRINHVCPLCRHALPTQQDDDDED